MLNKNSSISTPTLITNFKDISTLELGKTFEVAGFVNTVRDHGGLLFIDLRSFEGNLQVVINPKVNKTAFEIAQGVGSEYVIKASGILTKRTEETINPKIENGTIELVVEDLEIISVAKTLPFDIQATENLANEEIRLKFRYLDLRRKNLQEILVKKHKFLLDTRNYFSNQDFIEIQTPILANSSPEGARDYLVPSRLHQGKFYALPQAPQQFKQLMMVGGFSKYFQIAPCFRDEDPRADRHPGDFYQIDAEVAFATDKEIYDFCWKTIQELFVKHTTKKLYPSLDILSYDTAMNVYGSDKPDLRIYQDSKQEFVKNLGWLDTKEVFEGAGFAVFESKKVQALVIKNAVDKFSRSDLDRIQDIGRSFGLPGIAYIQYMLDGEVKSPIVKFFTDQEKTMNELSIKLGSEKGDLVLFLANENESMIYKAQNAIRKHIAIKLELTKQDEIRFVWIDDMPFFESDEKTGKIEFGHNPFGMFRNTEGKTQMETLIEAETNNTLTDLRAVQYDIACNGYEVLSGGQRNSNPELLMKAFNIAGYSKEEVQEKFGHMLEAYSYGAPYHAGFAWGSERLFMCFNDIDNIREVIAFPKNGQGMDLVMGSPSSVRPVALKDLGIKLN
jgi:aspartyl-tRNA synthetase